MMYRLTVLTSNLKKTLHGHGRLKVVPHPIAIGFETNCLVSEKTMATDSRKFNSLHQIFPCIRGKKNKNDT